MSLLSEMKRVWRDLSVVPDCRACNGTGDAAICDANGHYTEWVYWQGNKRLVCGVCKGKGKV